MSKHPADGAPRGRVVTTESEWDLLEGSWGQLLRSVHGHTALQTHSFLRCWWRHHGDGITPWIVVVTRGDRVVAIAPLQLVRRTIWGRRYRVLELLGMPDELDRPALLVPPDDPSALAALLDAISERRSEWDLIQLDELEAGSWQIPALRHWARSHRLWCRSQPFHPCPYLDKGGATWEDYLGRRSERFGKRLRQARRRLEKAGPLSHELSSDGGDLAAMVDTFFEVEARSWKAKDGIATGADARYRAFCGDLLTDRSAPYTGHAIVQRLDGRATAATFGLSMGGVYYSLQIAHDQAFDRYSPGTLLEAFEMEWFFRNRTLQRYEFLGGAVFNKRRWTDTAVATSQVFIRRPGVHIALKDLSRFYLRPAFEKLRRRARGEGSFAGAPYREG